MSTEKEEQTTESWLKEAQKGYIRMGILILLNKKPAHGYEIMKEINNRTGGFLQPTPGGVYPILRDLEKSSFIKGQWQTQKNRRLKVYKITKSGELILRRAIVKQAEISNNIGNLFREFARDVLNIETQNNPLPHLPSFFSAFLKDDMDSEKNIGQLELERQHTYESITTMRERLRRLNNRIRDIKKQERTDSSAAPM